MPLVTPNVGDSVTLHRRRPAYDGPAEVAAVSQPGGSQVDLTVDGQTVACIDHVSFAGDPATSDHWSYGDERDGLPAGDLEL
jgi:hypothetical protein